MRRWFGWMLVVLLFCGGIVAAVRDDGGQSARTSADTGPETSAATAPVTSSGDSVARRKLAAEPALNATAPVGGGAATAGAVAEVPRANPRVVKHATVELRVTRRVVDRRFASAGNLASFFGGFVQSSERSGDVATVTMRIPAERFGDAIARLTELGKVTARSERGDDVTAQFVDLEARIRNLTAQEGVLQDLMRRAESIPDTLAVRSELQGVREQIELLTGQRNLLDDQASFGTIAVTFHTGAVVAVPVESSSTLARAWQDAVGVTLGVLAGALVVLGAVIPVGLIALLALGGWVLIRRRRGPVLPAQA